MPSTCLQINQSAVGEESLTKVYRNQFFQWKQPGWPAVMSGRVFESLFLLNWLILCFLRICSCLTLDFLIYFHFLSIIFVPLFILCLPYFLFRILQVAAVPLFLLCWILHLRTIPCVKYQRVCPKEREIHYSWGNRYLGQFYKGRKLALLQMLASWSQNYEH